MRGSRSKIPSKKSCLISDFTRSFIYIIYIYILYIYIYDISRLKVKRWRKKAVDREEWESVIEKVKILRQP
jgi:hypothetical protein